MTREEALKLAAEIVGPLFYTQDADHFVRNIAAPSIDQTARADKIVELAEWLLKESAVPERRLIGYRDCDGDLWTQNEHGMYVFGGADPKTLESLRNIWGPLTEVYADE